MPHRSSSQNHKATAFWRVLPWVPALLYMALIFFLSELKLTGVSFESVPLRDKGVHLVEYAVLGLLVTDASFRTWPTRSVARLLTLSFVITVSWGVLDELHQALSPFRSAELLDLAADAIGGTVGITARALWRRPK